MTTNKTQMQTNYLFHAALGFPPAVARAKAQIDCEQGKDRYYKKPAHGAQFGCEMANRMRWGNPDACGLRFVGWADELQEPYSRRARHTGYYARNDECSEVLRGCVYQGTARDGKAVFYPAYREGENMRKGWDDLCGEHSAAIAFRDAFSFADAREAKADAARAADRYAEIAAEKSRDYDCAFQAGQEWAWLGDGIQTSRKECMQLIRELKTVSIPCPPMISQTLRVQIKAHRNNISQCRRKRADLLETIWREYHDAFNEGAGETVLTQG